jgi:hypothetical protein
MESRKNIMLIDGSFDPESAKDILVSLLQNKVHFHTVKSLSFWERTGVKDVESIMRLEQLKLDRELVLKLMQEAELEGKKVVIKSTIEIDFKS